MKALVIRYTKPCEWCDQPFDPHEVENSRFCSEECLSEFSWALLHWATRQWVEKKVLVDELAKELEAEDDDGDDIAPVA